MNRKNIRVYIEGQGGGGTPSKRDFNASLFRESWSSFLKPLAVLARSKGITFNCVIGYGGGVTLDQFTGPLSSQDKALKILLIDSEGPIKNVAQPWSSLPNLERPPWATDMHCYLMVQCLETWLVADPEGLQRHYDKTKSCFQKNKLKTWAWSLLETIPKRTVQDAIEQATSKCGNPYRHAHGNFLIAAVDRDKLANLPSVKRLFQDFAIQINSYAAQP